MLITIIISVVSNLQALVGQPFICTQYNLTDGLVGNNVRKIIQDQKGFIWIATWDGLCRFDGYRFTKYTTREGLTANYISDIIEIVPGTMLVAPSNKKLMQIVNGEIKSGCHFSNALVTRFLKNIDGDLLALSLDSGVLQWQNGKFIPIFPDSPIKLDDLIELNDTLYAGVNNISMWLLNNKFKPIGPEERPIPREYHSFSRDNHQNIWVKTNKGIALLSKEQQQGSSFKFQPLPRWLAKTPVANTYTRAIIQDRNGKYWVGNDAGVFYLDSSGYYYHFSTANGLPTTIVTCLMQDREDNIWVGTSTGVVKIALKNNFRFIKASDGLPNALVHHLLPVNDEQALLFSNGKSWFDLRNGSILVFEKFKPGWKHKFKTADNEELIMRDGYIEIYSAGTKLSVVRKWRGEKQPFLISRIEKDTYFIGKQKGFEFETPEGVLSDSLSIPHRISSCVAGPMGNIWVGTWEQGVFLVKWNRKNGKLVWETKKIPDSLFLNNAVRSMYIDKDRRLWVGSRHGGLVCLQVENENFRQIHSFSNQKFFSSNSISAINADNKNNIWVGTGHGLVKLIPADSGYRSFNFSQVHQAPIAINQINFLSGNRLVASGIDGLILAHDDEVDTLPPPACYITEVIITGQSPPTNYAVHYNLSYKSPNIIFHYSAPVFFNEKMVEFSYRLVGNGDSMWMESGRERSVNFASLSPGSYRFEVRALGWNGEWGEPATFLFSVSTPYWQKWWFLVICIITVSGIVYAFYNYRINQIIKLQKIRDSIAADLHDDIGSTLTNINILSDLSKKNIDLPDKAGSFIERIGTEVQDLQESLDDIIWSVNTHNDTLEETVYRMRRYAAELFDASDTDYSIDFSDLKGVQKLGMQQRRDLYLLFKESINNIYKHAEARNVQIVISLAGQQLTMKIIDDGKGFNKSLVTKRNGLKNLKKRVNKYRGNIEINSEPGEGTHIQIIIPILNE